MRILIVDDEEKEIRLMEQILQGEGFVVEAAMDGETAFEKAKKGNYDVILLDLMMPKRSGHDVIAGLRALEIDTPILIISNRTFAEDQARGLNLGADDYLVKNFSLEELVARVKSLSRRSRGGSSNLLRCGDLVVNLTDMSVRRGGRSIALSKKEMGILVELLRHKNALVSREEILDQVWGTSALGLTSNSIEVHIRALRRKVDEPFPNKLIHTLRGYGYIVRDPK